MGLGRVTQPGGKPSSFKYVCEAEGCGKEIRCTDLATHYKYGHYKLDTTFLVEGSQTLQTIEGSEK